MNPLTQQSKPAASTAPATRIRIGAALVVALALVAALGLKFSDRVEESTSDAYVEGNIVQVTPQLGGSVVMIAADNTDVVKAGQPLVQFNDVDARIALERAGAQLAHSVRQVRVQFANATQSGATVTLRAIDLARAEADLVRRQQLGASGAVSGEDIRHADDAVKAARATLTVAEQQSLSSKAMVDQTSIATHPDVRAAISQLREAYLAIARTTVRAPVGGIVSKRNVQLGQRVNAGTVLMSIVPPEQMWINANFKESQMRDIRVGQAATLHADVYGNAVTYRGRIIGQDAGTGSAFSLLPPQNASGNWIKVVQRVPVRIALEPAQLAAHPLKLGLSMQVSVSTGGRDSAVTLEHASARPPFRTDVFGREMEQADQMVQRVIAANLGKLVAGVR